ncbi:MAG TPA: DUF4276 family protein [Thermoanaerobaculia bacterium]
MAIVEGEGDSRAVPKLTHRWLRQNSLAGQFFVPEPAIKAKSCGNLKAPYDPLNHRGIEHYVLGALRARPAAILVILDADDECIRRPRERRLGPELQARAQAAAGRVPVGVVVANREFEAWFLADLPALRRAGVVPEGAPEVHGNPEARAGCKSVMGRLLGRTYEEAVHQAKLAAALSFSEAAHALSPSYAKLERELKRLTAEALKRSSP